MNTSTLPLENIKEFSFLKLKKQPINHTGIVKLRTVDLKEVKKVLANVTDNSKDGFSNFILSYDYNNMKLAIECASDFLETNKDIQGFEILIKLFMKNKISILINKINEDCTWYRKEIVFNQK